VEQIGLLSQLLFSAKILFRSDYFRCKYVQRCKDVHYSSVLFKRGSAEP